jgi:ribosome maturation factor RimP
MGSAAHFFLVCHLVRCVGGALVAKRKVQRIKELIEQTVDGLGFEIVDIEFAASGLLRVFIDHPFEVNSNSEAEPKEIQVGDCQQVSNQLGHVLLVEDYDYDRLEVSSPGMDRPLKTAAHFRRFAGEQVKLKLRQPFEGRRNFEGLLTDEGGDKFGIEMFDAPEPKPKGNKRTKKKKAVPVAEPKKSEENEVIGQKLVFEVNEVERARLVPQYEFRRHS